MSDSVIGLDVLKLNKHWQVIAVIPVRKAFEDMFAGTVLALQIEEGTIAPLKINDWLKLEVRDCDDGIGTVKQRIRVPRVVITVSFDKVIVKPPKLTLRNLRLRDNDTCIYTGKKLKPSEMSIEHIVPTSKNGQHIWENVALCDREINSKRGNKSLEEAGLKPLFKPFAPRGKKPYESIKNKFSEWEMFLRKN